LSKNLVEKVLACKNICLTKKAIDVVVLDISNLTTIADYFVICSGSSDIHVQAIAETIEEFFAKENIPFHREGEYKSSKWILIDGGDIVVHIFHEDMREFYDIENLWGDAEIVSSDKKM
jgi:ribosome-associated protein